MVPGLSPRRKGSNQTGFAFTLKKLSNQPALFFHNCWTNFNCAASSRSQPGEHGTKTSCIYQLRAMGKVEADTVSAIRGGVKAKKFRASSVTACPDEILASFAGRLECGESALRRSALRDSNVRQSRLFPLVSRVNCKNRLHHLTKPNIASQIKLSSTLFNSSLIGLV